MASVSLPASHSVDAADEKAQAERAYQAYLSLVDAYGERVALDMCK